MSKWGTTIARQRKGIISYKAKAAHWQGAVRTMKDGREVCQQQTKAGADEYKLRRMIMRHRQKCLCALCGLWMSEEETTFDHERGRGGGKRDDRIEIDGKWHNAAVHWLCNGDKGSRKVAYVITQDLTSVTKFVTVSA